MKITQKTWYFTAVGLLLFFLLISYWSTVTMFLRGVVGAVAPLIIGLLIAYIVNIPMRSMEKNFFSKTENKFLKKIKRPFCMVLSFLILVGIIVLVLWLVVPQIIKFFNFVIEKAPGIISSYVKKVSSFNFLPQDVRDTLVNFDVNMAINEISKYFSSILDYTVSTVSAVFSGVVNAFLSIMFAFYILLSKENLKRQVKKVFTSYIKREKYQSLSYFYHILNDSFHRYIVGQSIEAVILGSLCTVGMLILNIPYATMIGAFICVTALIPVAGAYIGAVLGAVIIVVDSPEKALIFLIYIIVLQIIEGNIIYPHVVGSSIGLPGIYVLAAVFVGGAFFGIAGMFLFVPLTAAFYRYIKEDVKKREGLKAQRI